MIDMQAKWLETKFSVARMYRESLRFPLFLYEIVNSTSNFGESLFKILLPKFFHREQMVA